MLAAKREYRVRLRGERCGEPRLYRPHFIVLRDLCNLGRVLSARLCACRSQSAPYTSTAPSRLSVRRKLAHHVVHFTDMARNGVLKVGSRPRVGGRFALRFAEYGCLRIDSEPCIQGEHDSD